MDLQSFDNKCIRITTAAGEVFEGAASYDSAEYSMHEYGCDQEALSLGPVLFYKDDIADILSLEDVNGPFGHFSEKYGLLERKCLEWGTDMIEEVLESEDDIQILRMLACMDDNIQSLTARAVPGMAPWRIKNSSVEPEDDENEQGPVYLGELKKMLDTLAKYNGNARVVKAAKTILGRLEESFPNNI